MSDLGLLDVGLSDEQLWCFLDDNHLLTSTQTQSDGFDRKMKQLAVPCRDQRQRGKNWEKTEEDILVEAKGRNLDWLAISDCLRAKGFIRDHRHCSDKWYALRKHYIEIHQWIEQNPHANYWELADSERIRTVPSSFCQSWYHIFDAAHQQKLPDTSGRKRVCRRRPPDPGDHSAHDLETFSEVGVLWTEIRDLSLTLKQKFAAEEEERIRNIEIKERKLQLKIDRFHYKRQRDEEMRTRQPSFVQQLYQT